MKINLYIPKNKLLENNRINIEINKKELLKQHRKSKIIDNDIINISLSINNFYKKINKIEIYKLNNNKILILVDFGKIRNVRFILNNNGKIEIDDNQVIKIYNITKKKILNTLYQLNIKDLILNNNINKIYFVNKNYLTYIEIIKDTDVIYIREDKIIPKSKLPKIILNRIE